jgi:hypothetical protein
VRAMPAPRVKPSRGKTTASRHAPARRKRSA